MEVGARNAVLGGNFKFSHWHVGCGYIEGSPSSGSPYQRCGFGREPSLSLTVPIAVELRWPACWWSDDDDHHIWLSSSDDDHFMMIISWWSFERKSMVLTQDDSGPKGSWAIICEPKNNANKKGEEKEKKQIICEPKGKDSRIEAWGSSWFTAKYFYRCKCRFAHP